MSASLEERIRGRLAAIDAAGEQRTLELPRGIDLCSNDYLGLAYHPLLKSCMAEAIQREGCGATAARLLRGERDCFSLLERRFAAFKGTERALFFGSGYAANLGMLTTFLEPGDVVFSDSFNHASLIDGIRLAKAERVIFPHLDIESLARLLSETSCAGRKFLVTESLFSMDGDLAPLAKYAELCRSSNALMLVDEAHAVGIYGAQGSGLIEHTGTANDVFLSMNTAGKALGAAGAFVAGPAWAIEYLVQRARSFMFSTAPPPALAAAIDAALDIIEAEPERRHRLRENVTLLRKLLAEQSIPLPNDATQIIPILIGDSRRAVAVAEQLQSDGYDVRAVRPPTVPEGTARLRLSLNSELTKAQLGGLADAISRVGASRPNQAATV
ncbi:MAG: 8-amino-7-oxononanoate synthase [Pyrinomonadaceae bacterium]